MRTQRLIAVAIAVLVAGGVSAQEPTTAEGYLKRGDDVMAANGPSIDHKKAIGYYTKAIELDGKFAKAYKQRAAAYQFVSKYKEVVDDYSTAIRLGDGDTNTYLGRGWAYSQLGKAELAISDFTLVLQLDAKNTTALYNRATAYISQGKLDKATADYDRLVEVEPTVSNYYTRGAYHRWTRKDLKAALADYTAIIGLEPNVADHYTRRGQLHTEYNDSDAAIVDYNAAIKLNPREHWAMYYRGKLHLKAERLDEAIADVTATLALSPTFTEAYLVRAEAAKRKGNPDQATADFNKAIECNPTLAGVVYLYQLGKLPDLLNYDSGKLLKEAKAAITANPKDADGYIRRAAVAHQLRNFEFHDGLADYTTALKLAPERAAALHVCRGALYHGYGRYASAVADYREALQLEPKMKLAENLLNASIAKLTEYKSQTTVESVRLDQKIILVANSFTEFTYPDGEKKEEFNTLAVKREVTVADVRRLDAEVRASIRQKQESSSGNSSSSRSSDSTTIGGGGSVGIGVFSFGGGGEHTRGSGSESGYTSSTLTGWESEFSTTVRKGVETSRTLSTSVESGEGVKVTVTGKGKDQPIRVIYLDKYRSGTAKLKINGVEDEVRFAFPVGKDINWEYVEKAKTEDKK